jgi:hypothetical protein
MQPACDNDAGSRGGLSALGRLQRDLMQRAVQSNVEDRRQYTAAILGQQSRSDYCISSQESEFQGGDGFLHRECDKI